MTTNGFHRSCAFCNEQIDPNSRYTWRRMQGWHRPGKAGGSDVRLRETLDGYAHDHCLSRVMEHIHPAQETLV